MDIQISLVTTIEQMVATIQDVEARCEDAQHVRKQCNQLLNQAALLRTMIEQKSTEILDYVKTSHS